jgi:hypothetical protein
MVNCVLDERSTIRTPGQSAAPSRLLSLEENEEAGAALRSAPA